MHNYCCQENFCESSPANTALQYPPIPLFSTEVSSWKFSKDKKKGSKEPVFMHCSPIRSDLVTAALNSDTLVLGSETCLETAETIVHQKDNNSGTRPMFSLSRYFLSTAQTVSSPLPCCTLTFADLFSAIFSEKAESASKEKYSKINFKQK